MPDPSRKTFLITPSGMPCNSLLPDDSVRVNMELSTVEGHRKPLIETSLHRDIYQARQDVTAFFYTRSLYVTMMATAKQHLPTIESTLVAIGDRIEISDYEDSGTRELAQNVIKGLGKNKAVPMANYRLTVVATSLKEGFTLAQFIEMASHKYIMTSPIGKVFEIPPGDLEGIRGEKKEKYGQQ